MAQRTVSVGLIANVSNYITNFERAAVVTKKTATAAEEAKKKVEAQGEAFTKLGTLALGAGTIAAAGIALVVKASAEYGAKMAQLQTLSHANADEMKRLSDAAMNAGAAYGFTASQVADAEIELTKAGIGVQAQLGGALKGALSLAAAGQMDVGQATEIATVAMTQFGLSAGQVPHLADLLSAGADKALGSVSDLGEGLKNGGLQAHNMGLSIDDTVGLLSAFANVGILGAEAGTQMRSMFLRLENPTSAARKSLNEYGISINDASGKFVGITKFAGELHDQLDKLTPANRNAALATIFGSHAIVGATALYQYGAKGIAGWITAVNDAGFANAQAAGKLNSLQGDVQKLAATFQTDLIKAGTDASGSLRGVVQSADGLLKFLGNLPQPLQDAGVELTVVVAGVGLLGGAALVAIPKVLAFKTAMSEAGVSARSFGGIVGKGGAVVAGLSAVAAGFAAVGQVGTANSQQIEQAGINIQNGWKGVDTVFKAAGSSIDSGHGLKASLDELGDGSVWSSAATKKFVDGATGLLTFGLAGTHLADVYKTNEGTFDAMGQQFAGLAKTNYSQAASSFAGLVSKYHLGSDETKNLLRLTPAYREELVALAGKAHVAASDQNLVNIAQGKGAAAAKVAAQASQDAADAADKQAAELGKLSGSAVGATIDINTLQKTIEGFGSAQLDARSATRAMYQAIDDATTAVKKNGRTLDVTTQAGRDNQAALDGIASSADNAASKTLKQTGSASKAADVMRTGRAAYIRAAEAMGLSASKANALADSVGLIPGNINVAVHTTGFDEAQRQADVLSGKMNNLDGTSATLYVNLAGTAASAAGTVGQIGRNALLGRAAGGPIDGPGPKGVDSVPVLAAPGEHVLTTKDVDSLGGQAGVYRFRSALAAGKVRGYASGGAIGQAREDFVSAQRRATGPIDPLTYVDDLRSMSRDTNWSASHRATFDRAANRYESALVRLTTRADAAATKLGDLRTASTQLRASITSAIAGGYQASAAGNVSTASGWITRDGIRMQTYSSGVTGASLASYFKAGGKSSATFASQLRALASRKVNPGLVAEIAGYGVEQGSPIAAAILSASTSELRTITSGYAAIQANAGRAGSTVASDMYGKAITAAGKASKALQDQVKSDGEKLRRLIARAFGLRGYATGTNSAAPGLHWVGENGPELLRFAGGEQVLTSRQSRAYVRGTSHPTSGGQGTIHVQVHMPSHMDVVDVNDQLIGTMRVQANGVAHQVVTQRNNDIAVHLIGAAQ